MQKLKLSCFQLFLIQEVTDPPEAQLEGRQSQCCLHWWKPNLLWCCTNEMSYDRSKISFSSILACKAFHALGHRGKKLAIDQQTAEDTGQQKH